MFYKSQESNFSGQSGTILDNDKCYEDDQTFFFNDGERCFLYLFGVCPLIIFRRKPRSGVSLSRDIDQRFVKMAGLQTLGKVHQIQQAKGVNFS